MRRAVAHWSVSAETPIVLCTRVESKTNASYPFLLSAKVHQQFIALGYEVGRFTCEGRLAFLSPVLREVKVLYPSSLCTPGMPLMVKETDLNRIEVPEDYEVLDATALGRRLGFNRDSVLAYLSQILALSS